MSDVVLVADGGEITVGRRVAGFVWGKWVTQVLDGEQPESDDPRLVQGFVYQPSGMPRGRFDVRGVRADITQVMAVSADGGIDYVRGSSNAEQVLDAAELRSDGEVFFESDITRVGLGPHVPGVDFDIDSVVDVQLCQRRIPAPVTAIDMTAENGVLGWRVHAGGQPIVDSVRLNSSNNQILGVLAQERREAAVKVAEVSSRVSQVSRVAHDAKTEAHDAKVDAAKADGKAVTAQETADDALSKWRQQKDETDRLQDAQIEASRKAGEAQKEINATFERRRVRVLPFTNSGAYNDWISITVGKTLTVTALGSWTGVVTVSFRVEALAAYAVDNAFEVTAKKRSQGFSFGSWESPGSGYALIMPN